MRRQLLTAVATIIVFTVLCGVVYPLAVTGIGQMAFGHQANGSIVTEHGRPVGSSLIGQLFTDSHGTPIAKYLQPRPSEAGDGYDPTASGASNLGPSNPLLIGFVPGVNTVGLQGRPSATNPFATATDPFCVPVDATSLATPVTTPTAGQHYTRAADGAYVCDPDTVPERAIAYRHEFGLAPESQVPVDAVTASGSGLDPDISIANAELQAPTVARARGLTVSEVNRVITANTTGRSLGVLGDPGVNVVGVNRALDQLAGR